MSTFRFEEIATKNIFPDEAQVRKDFEDIDVLAASVKRWGVIQPIVVFEVPDTVDRFQIIAGERRWRAAKEAKLKTVPCRIVDAGLERADVVAMQIEENDQRANIKPLERASAVATLKEETGLANKDIAKRFAKSQAWVSNQLALLEYPEFIQARVNSGNLSPAHVRALNPWRDWPELLADVHEQTSDGLFSRDEFADAVYGSVLALTRPVDPDAEHFNKPLFKIDKALKEQLDIIKVSKPGDSNPVERARNVGLWDEKQDEAKKASRGIAKEEKEPLATDPETDIHVDTEASTVPVDDAESEKKAKAKRAFQMDVTWNSEVVEWLQAVGRFTVSSVKPNQLGTIAAWCCVMVEEYELAKAARIALNGESPDEAEDESSVKIKHAIRSILGAKPGQLRSLLEWAVQSIEDATILLELCQAFEVDVFADYQPSVYLVTCLPEDELKKLPYKGTAPKDVESEELREWIVDNYDVGKMPGSVKVRLKSLISDMKAQAEKELKEYESAQQ